MQQKPTQQPWKQHFKAAMCSRNELSSLAWIPSIDPLRMGSPSLKLISVDFVSPTTSIKLVSSLAMPFSSFSGWVNFGMTYGFELVVGGLATLHHN